MRAGLFIAFLAFVVGASLSHAAPGERVVLPSGIEPVHYDIWFEPNAANLTFAATVNIDLDVKVPGREVVLNAADLVFDEVKLSGRDDTPRISIDDDKQQVTFRFGDKLGVGRQKLFIRYSGRIYQQASGVFALDYEDSKQKKRALFSQFETADARRFVPSWDEPNRKATFALSATVPADEFPVSNMPIVKTSRSGAKKTVKFDTSPKMSTYLLFFSSGDMERLSRKVGKVELGVVVRRGETARARYALDAAARILPYLETYFGSAYPLPKLDFIAGPGSSQFFGAMENWGAIFYFERAVLFDPQTSTETDKRRIYNVIAHEMAHQWFGNIVTMDWWDDLWLNEGYATWMAFKVSDHFHPEWNVMLDMVNSKDRAMTRDARIGTHPVIQPINDVLQAAQAFDTITYQKGAAVIRMLENHVGEKPFREGVRTYIKRHAYQNARTDDLWKALSESTGVPVTEIAHDFTLQEGIPLIHVRKSVRSVTLTQSRFAMDASGDKVLTWHVPVIASAVGGKKSWRGVTKTHGATSISLHGKRGIILNAGQSGYYKTLYEPILFEQLARNFNWLLPADQLGLIYDTKSLGYAGTVPLSQLLELSQKTNPKMHPRVQLVVAQQLDALAALYQGKSSENSFRRFALRTLRPLFAKTGWKPRRGEGANLAILREALLDALNRLGDPDIIRDAKLRFRTLLKQPRALEAGERRATLKIVSRHADPKIWEQLKSLAETSQSNVEKERYYALLGSTNDRALAQRALGLTLTDEVAPTSRPNIIAAVGVGHAELAFDFVNEHRQRVMDWLEPTSREEFVPEIVSDSFDEALIAKLHAYADKHIPASARRAVDVAAGKIALSASIRNKRLPDTDTWLNQGGY